MYNRELRIVKHCDELTTGKTNASMQASMERDTPGANCLWRKEGHWPSHETEVKEIDGGNWKSLNVQTVAFDVLHSKLMNSTVRIPKRGM